MLNEIQKQNAERELAIFVVDVLAQFTQELAYDHKYDLKYYPKAVTLLKNLTNDLEATCT